MPYPKEQDNRMIALLHLLVHRRVITKQEATDLFSNGKQPITEKMRKNTIHLELINLRSD